jgi:hypothetical protein
MSGELLRWHIRRVPTIDSSKGGSAWTWPRGKGPLMLKVRRRSRACTHIAMLFFFGHPYNTLDIRKLPYHQGSPCSLPPFLEGKKKGGKKKKRKKGAFLGTEGQPIFTHFMSRVLSLAWVNFQLICMCGSLPKRGHSAYGPPPRLGKAFVSATLTASPRPRPR